MGKIKAKPFRLIRKIEKAKAPKTMPEQMPRAIILLLKVRFCSERKLMDRNKSRFCTKVSGKTIKKE
jgi:hypothetical protein